MTRACFAHGIAGRGNVRFAHTGVICVRRLRARPRAGALPCAAVWGHLVPATVPRAPRFPLGACAETQGPRVLPVRLRPAMRVDVSCCGTERDVLILLRPAHDLAPSSCLRLECSTECFQTAADRSRGAWSVDGHPGSPAEGTLPARSDGRLAGKPGASRGAVPFLHDRGGRARAEACVAPTGGGVRNQRL